MEPRTRLDHALFQLTPTRTRCDLVIFAGKEKEKLASGLLAPFVSHLNSANDQISRGGYSITLRPATADAPWFTKGTLQRFVRFVSTPEILERFVTLEKEIAQIEDSIQANEAAIAAEGEGNEPSAGWDPQNPTATAKAKGEPNGSNDDLSGENSKVHLQRVLETRKAVLCKEQAMAYARALVVGFELEYINDLIAFAEAFGASRLRSACSNFMELCKRKNEDKIWMAEIAAMQACSQPPELSFLGNSGIMLAGEDQSFPGGKRSGFMDASSQESPETSLDGSFATSAQTPNMDGKTQGPMPWPANPPHYMSNFQGHAFQQVPPYHGYFFPGMQSSPFYPGNMPWPPNVEDHELSDYRSHRHSRNKNKSLHKKGIEVTRQEESGEHSGSSTESESDTTEQQRRKRHGKKASRKVVIRNINYITSKRNGEEGSNSEESSQEEELIDEESLKKQVEEAVGSLERKHKSSSGHRKKHGKSKKHSNGVGDEETNEALENSIETKGNGNWDVFQNLLMKEKDPASFALDPLMNQDESFATKRRSSIPLDLEPEIATKQHANADDSFIAARQETTVGGEARSVFLEDGENVRPKLKKMGNNHEEMLFPRIAGNVGSYAEAKLPDIAGESTLIRIQSDGDCIIGNQAHVAANHDGDMKLRMFDGDDLPIEKTKKDILPDDSFMIQEPLMINDQRDSQLKTDISIVTETVQTAEERNGNSTISRNRSLPFCEPDDLSMVLGRDTATESTTALRTPEIDQEYNIFATEVNGMNLNAERSKDASDLPSGNKSGTVNNNKTPGANKVPSKDARSKLNGSLPRSRQDLMSRGRKQPLGGRTTSLKSKSEQEEQRRKRMEELLIQRQKRIAERSAANGAKKAPTVDKTVRTSTRASTGEKTKPVLRNSTIDRLAMARTAPKEPSTQTKSGQQKPVIKKGSAPAKPATQKIPSSESEKPKASNTVPQDNSDALVSGIERQVPSSKIKTEPEDAKSTFPAKLQAEQTLPSPAAMEDCKDIKELHSVSPVEKIEVREVPHSNSDDKSSVKNSMDVKVSPPGEDHSLTPKETKRHQEALSAPKVFREEKCISNDFSQHPPETTVHPKPASPKKTVKFSDVNIDDNGRVDAKYLPRVPEIDVSTPPSIEGITTDHSRRKYTDETSPRASKGLRKLLFFGKKSRA